MNVIELLGGFYIDARRVEFACLMPFLGIVRTHLGDLQPLAHQLPLFTRIANLPEFQIAGAANESIGTVHYHDGQWFLDPRVSHGENGCIFDCDGILRIIEPAPDQTSQGYRYVAPDCRLVLGDETILKNGVSKYTDLSAAQDGSFLIGQGHEVGGIVVFIDGKLRMIQPGECYEPRAYLEGDVATVGFYEVQPDGLSAFIVHATVDELRALTPIGEAPTIPAPKIAVTSYDALLKAGEPWHLGFTNRGDGTQFLVTKDARDRLWIEAQNISGSDRTGTVRQLTVEGPTPEPEPTPEPPMLGRFWLQPNIGSRDLLEMFQRFQGFGQVDAFVFYDQHIHNDEPNAQINDNTYPNLVAAGAFKSLRTAAIPTVIEMGVIKDWDCTGEKNIARMRLAVQRVRDAGGQVAAFSMDEPITGSEKCNLSLAQIADRVANYVHACRDEGVGVVLLEAWPNVPIGVHQELLAQLATLRALPDAYHPDIDWNTARDRHLDPAKFIREMQAMADHYGITFGLFVNSTVDPILNDATHYGNLHQLARKIHDIHPLVAQVHVASWARRGPGNGPQDVPYNLPPYGLVESLTDTRGVFEPSQPQPIPEIDPMDYKLVDYVLHIKGTKPSSAQDKVNAILPDDRVAKVTPDGLFGTSDPGTDFDWERAYDRQNLLLFEPVPGKRYAVAYRVNA